MTIAEAPTRSASVEQVVSRMNTYHAELRFGSTPDPQTMERLRRMYGRLDAITTRNLEERDTYQLASGFTSLAELCRRSLAKYKRGYGRVSREKMTIFLGEVLLDKISLLMKTPDYDRNELEADVDEAALSFGGLRAMQTNLDAYCPQRYDHKMVGGLFGTISADTTRIYLQAQKATPGEAASFNQILPTQLGKIATNALGHAAIIAAELAHKRGPLDHLMGRFVEICAFVKKLFDWRDAPASADSFVRFAVEREDCPPYSYKLRRGFDLLAIEAGREQLIQVKAAGGGGVYHEAIRVLRLARPAEVAAEPLAFVGLFSAALEPEADYSKIRQEIDAQFRTV